MRWAANVRCGAGGGIAFADGSMIALKFSGFLTGRAGELARALAAPGVPPAHGAA